MYIYFSHETNVIFIIRVYLVVLTMSLSSYHTERRILVSNYCSPEASDSWRMTSGWSRMAMKLLPIHGITAA